MENSCYTLSAGDSLTEHNTLERLVKRQGKKHDFHKCNEKSKSYDSSNTCEFITCRNESPGADENDFLNIAIQREGNISCHTSTQSKPEYKFIGSLTGGNKLNGKYSCKLDKSIFSA